MKKFACSSHFSQALTFVFVISLNYRISQGTIVHLADNVMGSRGNMSNMNETGTTRRTFSESANTSIPTLSNTTTEHFIWSKGRRSNTDTTTVSEKVATAIESEKQRTFRSKHHHEHHWGPFFEEPFNSTSGDHIISTAHLYMEAVLNCRVGMLKDKTVMWLRRTTEKVSLLTVGNVTYTGDPRIRVKFQYPNNWRLLINPALKEDAGVYMCQVSTHPPRVFATNLTILEPPLRLVDDQGREITDRYYKYGSTIDLRCQISKKFVEQQNLKTVKSNKIKSPNDLSTNETDRNQTRRAEFERQITDYAIWTKDDDHLPPTTIRKFSSSEKWLNSRISILDAKLADSGNYSCSIGKVFNAIVHVQVLTGELPAAVQHNSKPLATSVSYSLLLICLIMAFIINSPWDIAPLNWSHIFILYFEK